MRRHADCSRLFMDGVTPQIGQRIEQISGWLRAGPSANPLYPLASRDAGAFGAHGDGLPDCSH